MNKNLWQISNELQAIINEIEEQGGEFTEEQINALTITRENLTEKIKSYCAVIDKYNSYIEACKAEKKRINELQKVRTNVIDRLKNILIETLNQFGDDSKSGNKVLELDTRKLFTRNTSSLSIDENRVNKFATEILSYIDELNKNAIYDANDKDVLNAILNAVNTIIKAENDETDNYKRFTEQDLLAINVNINVSFKLIDFIKNPKIIEILSISRGVDFKYDVDKDMVKFLTQSDKLTIVEFVKNTSLVIK